VYFAVNGVAWSLSCEAFFYVLFPFILPWVIGLTMSWRRAVMALVVGAIVAVAFVAHLVLRGTAQVWFPYILPVTRLFEFVLGILVALEVRDGSWPDLPLWAAVSMAVAAYAVVTRAPPSFRWVAVTVVPFSFVIGAVASRDLGRHPPWFTRSRLVVLGEWSFAFYLLHQLVLRSWLALGLPTRGVVAGIGPPLLLAASVLLSALLFAYFERPMERRLRSTNTITS
jgi:peptidoglycan/LPS O-acetylase OafA/YrhL